MVNPGGKRRRRGVQIAVIAAVIAALGIAAAIVVPLALQGSNREVAEADTSTSISIDGVTATVPVLSGWWTEPGNKDSVTVGSPDGKLVVEFTVAPEADAVDTIEDLAPSELNPIATEATPSGTLVYARAKDGSAVVGVVDTPEGQDAGMVTFVARGPVEHDRALAELLAGVGVAP